LAKIDKAEIDRDFLAIRCLTGLSLHVPSPAHPGRWYLGIRCRIARSPRRLLAAGRGERGTASKHEG
jgi:hypothetical protein